MKSIIQTSDDRCFWCGVAIGTEWHHIFGAANRRISEEDGLKIRLCRSCHEEVHCGSRSADMQKKLHQLGQIKWEMTYGTPGQEREQFMARYGRNYL